MKFTLGMRAEWSKNWMKLSLEKIFIKKLVPMLEPKSILKDKTIWRNVSTLMDLSTNTKQVIFVGRMPSEIWAISLNVHFFFSSLLYTWRTLAVASQLCARRRTRHVLKRRRIQSCSRISKTTNKISFRREKVN